MEARSKNMAAIRSSENKSTELKLVRLLRANRVTGWRRNQQIYGKPDFVFPKKKTVLFVDGCFWHGCKCKTIPKQNRSFWSKKIKGNSVRDVEVGRFLRKEGWKVLRIWEHDVKKRPGKVIERVSKALKRSR